MGNKKKGKLNSKDLQREVYQMLKRHPKKRYNAKEILQKIKVKNNRDSVQAILEKLLEKNRISEVAGGKFRYNTKHIAKDETNISIGIVDMTQNGSAYIVCDELEEDIYVPARRLNFALDHDRVKVSFNRGRKNRLEGEVVNVIERGTLHFIGTLNLSSKYAFLIPDKLNMPVDVFIPLDETKGAKDGDKVVVKVVKWHDRGQKSPIGHVASVLGPAGSSDIEMKSILIQHGFELEFPDAVMNESNKLDTHISEEEISLRRDFRGITTFTIDPLTAKDFDDALSIQYLENGNCEVGIHIADVSHYVKAGTALDREAYKRSTSVYLVDRVLPMLPEKLSNELCSLRPNEDKLTFSAVFTFNKDNKIVDRWYGRTIIHSDNRFTYEEAQEVLEGGEGPFKDELKNLNRLAYVLRKEKFKNGAIAFESPEVRFRLDETGKPIELYVKERKDAHMLVEDFMLLANRGVAEEINKLANGKEIPFVYRIHDEPDQTKVEDFLAFAAEMELKMKVQTPKQLVEAFNRLSDEVKKRPELKILEPLAIRTMSKAAYSTKNIGHYGLGFEFYTHFTSPIRRYSDVLVHRVLEKNLTTVFRVDKDKLEERCVHISRQERKAMDAERESIKYKQVEFMREHIGKEYDGIINGMIDRGIFVQITENSCEGMVPFDRMSEGYNLQENRLSCKGRETGHILKLGDPVKVIVIDADLDRRKIELGLVEA